MTNLTATIVIVFATNWVNQSDCEVGIVRSNRLVEVVADGVTNRMQLASSVVPSLTSIRPVQPVDDHTNFWAWYDTRFGTRIYTNKLARIEFTGTNWVTVTNRGGIAFRSE